MPRNPHRFLVQTSVEERGSIEHFPASHRPSLVRSSANLMGIYVQWQFDWCIWRSDDSRSDVHDAFVRRECIRESVRLGLVVSDLESLDQVVWVEDIRWLGRVASGLGLRWVGHRDIQLSAPDYSFQLIGRTRGRADKDEVFVCRTCIR